MRRLAGIVLIGLVLVAACSDPAPRTGLWEGVHMGDDAIIVARLEISSDGVIRVSAPNAFRDFGAMPMAARTAMLHELQIRLDIAWPSIAPMELTFDGTTFRKPGGVAPQLEWDDRRQQMTLVVYPGLHPTIRVPLTPVAAFGDEKNS